MIYAIKKRFPFYIEAKLMIQGNQYTPNQLSNIIDIIPHRSYLKGDLKSSRSKIIREKNTWIYIKKTEDDRDHIVKFEDLIEQLVSSFDDRRSQLKDISKTMEIKIFCAIYGIKYWPALIISPKVSNFLSDIDANLEFDLYGLFEEDKDEE
jgi:hypothetical protein